MTDAEPLQPRQIRLVVKWLTGRLDVGVIKRRIVPREPENRTIYVAYLQLDRVSMFKGDDGLWNASGSGPTADGMNWLEIKSTRLDDGYTQMARILFPDLAEVKMHCEVLHKCPGDIEIRRWISNAGPVMTRSRPLDHTDPHFMPDESGQRELIWSFTEWQKHFRIIYSTRPYGTDVYHSESWPKGDF
ncbi:hypothetical protein [Streptomyces prunicolor]|uniref:hypothetical protein n=1 Tax=Streptomyces prunicolor TaxID=67348 RepID=UPI001319C220|nr:hypothetical protein [Streptomyces prunicolor]